MAAPSGKTDTFGRFDPIDTTPIDPALNAAMDWQTRLLADGFDALPECLAAYPDADPRELKRMIRQARAMCRTGTPRVVLGHLRALETRRRDAEATTGNPDTMDRD